MHPKSRPISDINHIQSNFHVETKGIWEKNKILNEGFDSNNLSSADFPQWSAGGLFHRLIRICDLLYETL